MTISRNWTKEEDEQLLEYARRGMRDEDILKHFPHRTLSSITARKVTLRRKGADIPVIEKRDYYLTKNRKKQ